MLESRWRKFGILAVLTLMIMVHSCGEWINLVLPKKMYSLEMPYSLGILVASFVPPIVVNMLIKESAYLIKLLVSIVTSAIAVCVVLLFYILSGITVELVLYSALLALFPAGVVCLVAQIILIAIKSKEENEKYVNRYFED